MRSERRRFLRLMASASAAFLGAHDWIASLSAGSGAAAAASESGPRILSLELLSAAPVAAMKEFYGTALGLQVLEEGRGRLTVAGGGTPITFVSAGVETGPGKPFYHFAFNIPENKLLEARSWQKERTPLLPIPERLRDPEYPDDVVHFRHWNAHSVFFLDPAGNVLEYIARHDLKNAAPGAFGSRDILYASEIGLIVDDVPRTASKMREVVGVDPYRNGDDQFMAVGDERGLLLVMKRGRILNFDPSSREKAAGVFPTVARVRGARGTKYLFPGFPYKIAVEA